MDTFEVDKIRIPRWEELPELDLYMDQVVSLIDKKLNEIPTGEDMSITSTMINNYVKQKIIAPPDKKKYNREHVAKLFVVFIMKKVFSINEIAVLLRAMSDGRDFSESYDIFSNMYEATLAGKDFDEPDSDLGRVIAMSAYVFTTKLQAQFLIASIKAEFDAADAEKKEKAAEKAAKESDKAKKKDKKAD